jgi:hypothetical protein
MYSLKEGEKKKKWMVLSVTLLSAIVMLVTIAKAETGRIVQHTYKAEAVEVGDVPGHTFIVVLNTGLVFFSGGEVAPTVSANILDLVKSAGTASGRRVINFQDGSTYIVDYVGSIAPADGGKKNIMQGTYQCTGGTGRFQGWHGNGTFKAERIGSRETGSDLYVDFSDNCKRQ